MMGKGKFFFQSMDQLVSLLSSGENAGREAEIVAHAKNAADRLVSDWVYAGNTSNQSKFGSFTLALATILSLPSFPEELAVGISKKILQEDVKAIYRALTAMRQAQTIPTLSLLQQIARFIPQDLFTAFDFTLRVIPKILSQQPYRQAFLQFYIELVSHSAPQTRRELFAHRRIFSGWIGKLGVDDDEETVKSTMDLLYTYVLKDTTVFTKTAKMGLFNDWTLKNMQRMLASSNLPGSPISEELSETISRFLVTLFCDRKLGIRMPGENRLALSFLKILKPWENVVQMDLCMRLLRDLPDVCLVYFETLASTYTLTPKQSMWWFSFSVLHIRMLKLPLSLPPANAQTNVHYQPKLDLMSKMVLPPTVTKAALLQSLQFESNLLRFQAAQIILFAVRRLANVVNEHYILHSWDYGPLVDEVLARLPDVNLLTKPVESSLLRTTYLTIVKEVCQLRPLSINISMPLDAKQVSGLDLVEAQTILEVATFTSDQTKWWSPSKDRFSLFTQLVQFSTFNSSLSAKCSELLQHLVEPTQLFADMTTLANPIDAFLFTLNVHHSPIVWAIIEQAVQRATRSPYQYIDKVKSTTVSPFVVALVEQWEHIACKCEDLKSEEVVSAKKWLLSYVRSLIVLGEDRSILLHLISSIPSLNEGESFISDESVLHLPWKSDEYFDFVLDASDSAILSRDDLVFKISNDLELAATLFKTVNTNNEKVRNHLLASIPADMHSLMASSPAAYSLFINDNCSKDLCQRFLTTIEEEGKSSVMLTKALENGKNWVYGLPFLSVEFLRNKLLVNDSGVLELPVLNELNARKYQLDAATIHSVLSSECTTNVVTLDSLAANLQLWVPGSFNGSEALDLMMRVSNSEKFVASLIKVSGRYPQKHRLGLTSPVLMAAARYASQDLDTSVALEEAQRLSSEGDSAAFAIMKAFRSSISVDSPLWQLAADFIEKSKQTNKSVLIPDLLAISIPSLGEAAPFLGRYLKIVVHQLTRQFAEKSITDSSFLASFNDAIEHGIDLWQYVHHNAVNALLEASLRFDYHSIEEDISGEIYRLVSVVSSYNSSHQTTLAQLATLFETRKPASVDMAEVIAIHFLFNNNNHEDNSTSEVEHAVLLRYSGSLSAKDRILLSILQKIESVRQRSWMENMKSLDVRPASQLSTVDDYGLDPLVVIRGSSLYITLDEQMILNTIQTYEPTQAWQADEASREDDEQSKYACLRDFVARYETQAPSRAAMMYDSWFLLNFIVSADYLYENLEVFLSSGLVSFVICNLLAPPELSDEALRILKVVFNQLPKAQFKDQVGLQLLLGKLLMTQATCQDNAEPLPSHLPGIVSQIALVLTKPNHFMHEKVAQWLLSSPQIPTFDIPLFKTVVQSSADFKMREMLWLINTLKSGAIDNAALQTYIRYGVMEWSLLQLDLLSPRAAALKEAINRFIDRAEELNGGSELLVTRTGSFAIDDLKQRLFYTAEPEKVVSWAGN